ncbi:hypothetical protein BU15DRAFT_90949 [Melanogaster broomeanus]|nr:hypothetical protein BU15DRAFT_90949 [Melanogaster broomeanus]
MVQTSLFALASLISGTSLTFAGSPIYTATYAPQEAPYNAEQGQSEHNQCGNGYNQTPECQNTYLNTVQEFCLWTPARHGPNSQVEVAWCMASGHGTRLIPDGTITGAHLVVTPDYVQVTGVGNLTNINLSAGDTDSEFDPHGTDSEGSPLGALALSNAFGQMEQIHEWMSFVSYNQFCFRACQSSASASTMCHNIYEAMGCEWNMPGNYDAGVFDNCLGDTAEGVYGTSTFYQGASATPSPHPIPSSSSCTTYSTISNGQGIFARTSSSSTPTSNPYTQIGSQCPVRTQGALFMGSSGAAAHIAPHFSWEELMFTIFAVVVGSSSGALFVL